MIVAFPFIELPGAMRIAIPLPLALTASPSLEKRTQGNVAVAVLPDETIEKLAEEFAEKKLLVGIVPPGATVNVFTVELIELYPVPLKEPRIS